MNTSPSPDCQNSRKRQLSLSLESSRPLSRTIGKLNDDSVLPPSDRFVSVASVQTISGTGANHLAGLFLSKYYTPWQGKADKEKTVYLSNPTWGASTVHDAFEVTD